MHRAERCAACTHSVFIGGGIDLELCRVVDASLELGSRHHGRRVSLGSLCASWPQVVVREREKLAISLKLRLCVVVPPFAELASL